MFDVRVIVKARLEKRQAALKFQEENTLVTPEGYTVRPAIGRTGGAENVGWELIPPAKGGPEWYFGTNEGALGGVKRHLGRYGEAKGE